MKTDTEDPAAGSTGMVQPARVKLRSVWTVVILCMLFMVINFADKSVMGFAGAAIRQDLGISAEQFGLLQSAFFWLFAAGAISISALTHKFSPVNIIMVLVVVWTATLIPLTLTGSFAVVLLCRIILGFAEGPSIGLAMAVAHSWVPARKRALVSGVVNAGSSLGPLIAAPILTWVIAAHSWHAGFFALIPVALAWLVAWFFLGRMGPETVTKANSAVDRDLPERVPYRTLLIQPTVIGIALLTLLGYCCVALKISWLPLFLTEGLGYSTTQSGLLVTLPYIVSIGANILFGWMSSRLSVRGIRGRYARGFFAVGLMFANGISMILFTVLGAGVMQMAFVALAFALYSGAMSLSFAVLADVVPPAQRSTVYGCVIAFYSLGGVFAPLLMGWVVGAASTAADGYSSGFMWTGTVMAIGCLVSLVLIRPEADVRRLVRVAATTGAPGPGANRPRKG